MGLTLYGASVITRALDAAFSDGVHRGAAAGPRGTYRVENEQAPAGTGRTTRSVPGLGPSVGLAAERDRARDAEPAGRQHGHAGRQASPGTTGRSAEERFVRRAALHLAR